MFSGTHGGRKISLQRHDRHVAPTTRARKREPDAREDARVLEPAASRATSRRRGACAPRRARRRRAAARRTPRSSSTGRRGRRRSSPTCRRRAAASGSSVPPSRRRARRGRRGTARSSRSSASIVTFVCSSPFHQPSSLCSASRCSTRGLERLGRGASGDLGHSGHLCSVPGLRSAGRAAARPLRTAPSIVAGQPVSVHAPATWTPREPRRGGAAAFPGPGGRSRSARA